MMRVMPIVAACAAACLMPGVAQAAYMVKSYKIDATYSTGPVTNVIQYVTLGFDPTLRSSASVTQSDYSVTSDNVAFQVSRAAQQAYRTSAVALYLYGTNQGTVIKANVADFTAIFDVTTAGVLTTARTMPYAAYTSGDGIVYESTTVTVSEASPPPAVTVAAVPEPATWLTMLLGFGGIGALLRRRRGAALAASG